MYGGPIQQVPRELSPWNPRKGIETQVPREPWPPPRLSPWNPRKGIETPCATPMRTVAHGYPHGIPERGLKLHTERVAPSLIRYPHGIPERGLKPTPPFFLHSIQRYPHGIPERGLKRARTGALPDALVIPMESPKGD